MADDKKIKFILELDEDGLVKGLKKADTQVDKFSRDSEKNIKKLNVAWGSFIGNVGANTVSAIGRATVQLAGYFIQLGRGAVDAAIEAEAAGAKFDTVFNDILPEASNAVNNLASNFRLTNDEATKLVGNTGDLLVGFGLSKKAALDLSIQTQQLSAALSDFNNVPVEQASRAITAAYSGEREALKSLGVVVSEELVKKEVLRQRAEGLEFATEQEAKAFATLALVTEQSGSAIQAFIDNSDKASTLIKIFNNEVDDLESGIGKALLPTFKELTKEAITFLKGLDVNAIRLFITNGIILLLQSLREITPAILPIVNSFQFLWNAGQIVFQALIGTVDTLKLAYNSLGLAITSSIQKVMSIIPSSLIPDEWEESLNNFKEGFSTNMDEISARAAEGSEKIKRDFNDMLNSFSNDEQTESAIERLNGFLSKAEQSVIKSQSNITKAQEKGIKNREDNQNKAERSYATSLKRLFNLDKQFVTTKKQFDKVTDEDRVKNQKDTLATIATLQSSNNKELFRVGQAAAIAQATIDGIAAVQKALASAPPPFNFALAGLVGAATAVNVGKIASQQPPKFATGGVIGGASVSGDNLLIAANSKERVLTARQNESFESLVDLATTGNGIGINSDLLVDINNTLIEKDFTVNIDGTKLNEELSDIQKRRLS